MSPKTVLQVDPEEFFLQSSGERVKLARWTITKNGETVLNTPIPENNNAQLARAFYYKVPIINDRDYNVKPVLPFWQMPEISQKFFSGQLIARVISEKEADDRRHGWALELSRYARYRMGWLLNPPKKDELATRLAFCDGSEMEIAPGRWSGAKTSMDAEFFKLEYREGDPLFCYELVKKYGEVSIRQAVTEKLKLEGETPGYASGAYQMNFGVCSVIFAEKDQKFMITRRSRGVGGLNVGRVCAASGGVPWEIVSRFLMEEGRCDLFGALHACIQKEHEEEIGGGSLLGAGAPEFHFIPVGFAGELPGVAGHPESFWVASYPGTCEDVLEIMSKNSHPDCAEVDGFVYALSPEDVEKLLRSPDGTGVIQYKGLVNLYFAIRQMGLW